MSEEIGRVVWHDLVTSDVERAKRFYQDLLGWTYEIEHAETFAWTGHPADYPLIVVGEAAHGGFVDLGPGTRSHWLAFVAVDDVDRVATRAVRLGADLLKGPFDIPGVGRASVVQDSRGAIVCPYRKSHAFPPPSGVFVWDELVTSCPKHAEAFYADLFGWQAESSDPDGHRVFKCENGNLVAGIRKSSPGDGRADRWIPYLAASRSCDPRTDPLGAEFGLLDAETMRASRAE